MSLSPLESPLWARLYGEPALRDLLGDAALIDRMIRVEAALAEACAEVGLIPAEAGPAIARALEGSTIAPPDLAEGAARDGVPVPALVAALRARLDPALGQYLHWGATSQDIVDSATALAVDAAIGECAALLDRAIARLAEIAQDEAECVMGARTRTQIGLPTTFGALVASWGRGLVAARTGLTRARPGVARLSLHGASGTGAAFGDQAHALGAALARRLGLSWEDAPHHAERIAVADLGHALAMTSAALGKAGLDLAGLAATREVSFGVGGSSTMPHKANPVAAEALQTAGRLAQHLQAALGEAVMHGMARDGVAWALEWHTLRALIANTGGALTTACGLFDNLRPRPDRMRAMLDAEGAGPYSEGAVFALTALMPRPEAVKTVKAALGTADPRAALARDWPSIDWGRVFAPLAASGRSAALARDFARSVQDGPG